MGKHSPASSRSPAISAVGVLWCASVVSIGAGVFAYENRTAAPAAVPSVWPKESAIARSSDRFTAVLFAHPDCSCSRATVSLLGRLMERSPGRLAVSIAFSKPGAAKAEVMSADLWRQAGAIPGVTLRYDDGGIEAARFGAEVSGQTLVYDPSGMLVFTGGLTASRGHEGDSPAFDHLIRRIRGDLEGPITVPVFGCSLRDPTTAALRESSWIRNTRLDE